MVQNNQVFVACCLPIQLKVVIDRLGSSHKGNSNGMLTYMQLHVTTLFDPLAIKGYKGKLGKKLQ